MVVVVVAINNNVKTTLFNNFSIIMNYDNNYNYNYKLFVCKRISSCYYVTLQKENTIVAITIYYYSSTTAAAGLADSLLLYLVIKRKTKKGKSKKKISAVMF